MSEVINLFRYYSVQFIADCQIPQYSGGLITIPPSQHPPISIDCS